MQGGSRGEWRQPLLLKVSVPRTRGLPEFHGKMELKHKFILVQKPACHPHVVLYSRHFPWDLEGLRCLPTAAFSDWPACPCPASLGTADFQRAAKPSPNPTFLSDLLPIIPCTRGWPLPGEGWERVQCVSARPRP